MPLRDWDDILLWLKENGAPAWCIKRREQELRDIERDAYALLHEMPGSPCVQLAPEGAQGLHREAVAGAPSDQRCIDTTGRTPPSSDIRAAESGVDRRTGGTLPFLQGNDPGDEDMLRYEAEQAWNPPEL